MKLDWTHGNHIALLENGESYYPRVFEAIAQAQYEVFVETFILFDDKVGRALQQALVHAARRGAEVHLLVDGWGSPDLGPEMVDLLIAAGVQVRTYERRAACSAGDSTCFAACIASWWLLTIPWRSSVASTTRSTIWPSTG
jgi:phosphatidylserine/phosphatidylglycerophosphate/cardiolipin synthase-like enzyme